MTYPTARVLHAAVAVLAVSGVLLDVTTTVVAGPADAGSTAEGLARLLSYFTIDSALLIAAVSIALAVRPKRDGPVFRAARLSSVLCIAVTGLVFPTVLGRGPDLSPVGEVSSFTLLTAVPVLALATWLAVGPRPRIAWATVAWSLVLPLAWLVLTFARGAVVGWYPYPFLDVTELGYAEALVNTAVVGALCLGLAALARLLEPRLGPAPRLGWARGLGPPGQS